MQTKIGLILIPTIGGIISLILVTIYGLNILINKLQKSDIKENVNSHIEELRSYISNEDMTYDLSHADSLFEMALKKDINSEFDLKRILVAEGSLILSEYYSTKYKVEVEKVSELKEWLIEGSSSLSIAALYQFVLLSKDDNTHLSEFRKAVNMDKVPLAWVKHSNQVIRIMDQTTPTLRKKMTRSSKSQVYG